MQQPHVTYYMRIRIVFFLFFLFLFCSVANVYGKDYPQKKEIEKTLETIGINLDFIEVHAVAGIVSIYGVVKSNELKLQIDKEIVKDDTIIKLHNNVLISADIDRKCDYGIFEGFKTGWQEGDLKYDLKNAAYPRDGFFKLINLGNYHGTMLLAGVCYDRDVKDMAIKLAQQSKGINEVVDLIFVEQRENLIDLHTPEYALFSLHLCSERRDEHLLKTLLSDESMTLYNEMIDLNIPEVLSELELDNLLERLVNSYRESDQIKISSKNDKNVEVHAPVLKDILGKKLYLIKAGNQWKLDITNKLKNVRPKLVSECIQYSEDNYDFKKLKGKPEVVRPYLLAAIKYDSSNCKAHNYIGMLLFAEENHEDATKEFNALINTNKDYFYPYYNKARIQAEKQEYEDALQSLKCAVRCPDFDGKEIDVIADFKDYPVILYALPEDLKDFGDKTNQMFGWRKDAIETQQKLDKLFCFVESPSIEIVEARRVLEKGDFEAAYINYMRHISHHPRLTDENLDEMLEALTIWEMAYMARICQISLSMYDTGGNKVIDEKLQKMISPSRREALKIIALRKLPSFVDACKGRFSNILASDATAKNPENITSTNIGFICAGSSRNGTVDSKIDSWAVALGTGGVVGGAAGGAVAGSVFGPIGTAVGAAVGAVAVGGGGAAGGAAADDGIEKAKAKKTIDNLRISHAPFKITYWKEATIDYTQQKNKYKESMKVLNNLIQREKQAGTLSSASLTKLTKTNELLTHYFICINKIYRSFLFDSPMKLNLIHLKLQISCAKGFFNDDESKMQEIGRQYSKLTPALKYVVLDNTTRQWEKLAKTIKAELGDNRFEELKQEAKTVPNWFVEID